MGREHANVAGFRPAARRPGTARLPSACAVPASDRSHARFEEIFDEVEAPFAFVDLDAMWSTPRRCWGAPARSRCASRASRCAAERCCDRILGARGALRRPPLTFTLPETLWLAEQGYENLPASPTRRPTPGRWLQAGAAVGRQPAGGADRDGRLQRAPRRRSSRCWAPGPHPCGSAIDIDASWWGLGGRVKVGPKRSPIHTRSSRP